MKPEELAEFNRRMDAYRPRFHKEMNALINRKRERLSGLRRDEKVIAALDAVLKMHAAGEVNFPNETVNSLHCARHDHVGYRAFWRFLESDISSLNHQALYDVCRYLALATGRRIADLTLGSKGQAANADASMIVDGMRKIGGDWSEDTIRAYAVRIVKEARSAPDGFRKRLVPPMPPSLGNARA